MTDSSGARWISGIPDRRGSRRAFTLLELIAVVTIIAVLATMLLVMVSTIRRSARQVVCAGNLRQIGMSITAYAADHRRFPPAIHDQNWTFGNLSSTGDLHGAPTAAASIFLEGYVDSPLLFYCPDSSRISPAWWCIDPTASIWTTSSTYSSKNRPGTALPADWVYSYISYCWWAGYSYAFGPTPQGIASRYLDSASTVLCSDMSFPADGAPFTGSHLGTSGGSTGGNVLYNDGRVVWVPFRAMSYRQTYFMQFYF